MGSWLTIAGWFDFFLDFLSRFTMERVYDFI